MTYADVGNCIGVLTNQKKSSEERCHMYGIENALREVNKSYWKRARVYGMVYLCFIAGAATLGFHMLGLGCFLAALSTAVFVVSLLSSDENYARHLLNFDDCVRVYRVLESPVKERFKEYIQRVHTTATDGASVEAIRKWLNRENSAHHEKYAILRMQEAYRNFVD